MSPTLKMLSTQQDLKNLHTFQLQAKAAFYSSFHSLEQLEALLQLKEATSLPKLVLGKGSNIVFLEDYNGLILHNKIKGVKVISETSEHTKVRVGAGEDWHELVLTALNEGWHGIENLALIPGTVGAAPVQNIGAYGVEVAQSIEAIHFYHWEKKQIQLITKQEAQFGYRDSIFKQELKNKGVICYVDFNFSNTPNFNLSYAPLQEKFKHQSLRKLDAQEVVQTVIDIRNSKLPDPYTIPNAGSFFKNPVISKGQYESLKEDYPKLPQYPHPSGIKVPAAYLIEQSGWKGRHLNTVGVHNQQALVLINIGSAKAEDLNILIQRIQKDVYQQFKILLEPEVQLIKNV